MIFIFMLNATVPLNLKNLLLSDQFTKLLIAINWREFNLI